MTVAVAAEAQDLQERSGDGFVGRARIHSLGMASYQCRCSRCSCHWPWLDAAFALFSLFFVGAALFGFRHLEALEEDARH